MFYFWFFVFVSHCVCNYVFSLEISWLRETLYAFRNMLYNETNLTFCKTNANSEHKIIPMQCHPIAKNKTVKIVRMFATDACYKNIDILSHQLETKTNTQYRRTHSTVDDICKTTHCMECQISFVTSIVCTFSQI